ncbi:MAG TPA: ATP-binding protein [Acidimicrobiales bacterium]|nr:ATP-binding protein [Acidimicrobiales bacterium]
MTAWPEVTDAAVGQVVARAASHLDLEDLTRPLLEALAKLAGLDCAYLTVFDWDRREQEVRFVHRAGDVEITEGSRLPLPSGVSQEILLGVTRSPAQMPRAHPDSQAAKRLGLRTYVSVPVVLPRHELFGMVCGASRRPQAVGEPVVSVMEFFAKIVADHVSRARVAAIERRAERAEELLRARGMFLAVAEHQLKTPLTSLLGAARVLCDRWPELGQDDRAMFLDIVLRSALDLASRVDALLVEARADVQARDLVPVDLDLVDFVGTITRAWDAAAADHQVRADIEEGLVAWADPTALHQVLGHLLDNARKYSPGPSAITVVGRRSPEGVALAVVDEGVGLAPGINVFEAFRRGDEGHIAAVPGIGLGLHIVRNLLEAMGGSVEAAANLHRGTTFTVGLPAGQTGSPARDLGARRVGSVGRTLGSTAEADVPAE